MHSRIGSAESAGKLGKIKISILGEVSVPCVFCSALFILFCFCSLLCQNFLVHLFGANFFSEQSCLGLFWSLPCSVVKRSGICLASHPPYNPNETHTRALFRAFGFRLTVGSGFYIFPAFFCGTSGGRGFCQFHWILFWTWAHRIWIRSGPSLIWFYE